MHIACLYVYCMGKTLQVRNVPDDVHRALKIRAATEGLTLSSLVLAELTRIGERPSRRELLDRLRRRSAVTLDSSVAEIIAAERHAR